MKKHLLSVLLAIALLVAVCVCTVSAAEHPQNWCEHCQQVVEQWSPLTKTGDALPSGHYYLDGTFTTQTSTFKVAAGNTVCIDLRGNDWVTDGIRIFEVSGTLSVMDSVGDSVILTSGKMADYGHSAFTYVNGGELNMYGGTVQMAVRQDIQLSTGGLIRIGSSGRANLYGGTIKGGVAQIQENVTYYAQGGNIYVADGGSLLIDGGTVTGGMAYTTVTKAPDANGKEQNVLPYGGNIFASGGSTVTLKSGTISDGYSSGYGGNIYVGKTTFLMEGGTISGGHALTGGGNICQYGSNENSVTISGGHITGGVAGGVASFNATSGMTSEKGYAGGGNYYARAASGSLTITGGVIDGDMKIGEKDSANTSDSNRNHKGLAAFTLSGAPKIGLGKSNGLLITNNTTKVNVTGLTEGAEIFVNTNGVFTTAFADEETAKAYLAYFKPAVRATLSVSSNALQGSTNRNTVSTGYCPHCYDPANPQLVTWYRSDLITADQKVDGVHVFVAFYTRPSAQASVNRTNVVMDLEGITVHATASRLLNIKEGADITLMDSRGGGRAMAVGNTKSTTYAAGGVVYTAKNATFTLRSGIIELAPVTDGTTYTYLGGNIYGHSSATLNIEGGVVRNGFTNKCYTEYFTYIMGGNIGMNSASGQLNVSGGIITGGRAMEEVVGETTRKGAGGNIYVPGTANISGGFILNGNASLAGNMRAATTYLSGGTVAFGTATTGGNLYAGGKFEMTGGTVLCGSATSGGNIFFLNSNETRTVTGGVVTSGFGNTGGNIYLYGTDSHTTGVLTISDNARILSGEATSGGSIYATCSTLHLGAKVMGGTAETGGNLYASSQATVNITGMLAGGDANSKGGNLFASATNTIVNINHGALITGGTCQSNGGNIYVGNGKLYVLGGVIENGVSKANGGNIYGYFNAAGIIDIKDDGDAATPLPQILNGTATTSGGNIYMYNYEGPDSGSSKYNNTLYLGNCVISGGSAKTSGQDVYISSKAYMEVYPEFDGEVTVYFYKDLLPENLLGGKLDEKIVCNGVYTGKLYLENHPDKPTISSKENDPALYIAGSALVDQAGTFYWFDTNADLVTNYNETTAYMVPNSGELALNGGDYVVNVNGQTLNITGSGSVACFDSANDTYKTFGSVTLSGVTLTNPVSYVTGGKTYIALKQEDSYSFHRLNMYVSGVTLRPSTSGLYYRCTWDADEALAAQLDTFGVAVSLKDMPTARFATDSDTLYTTLDAAAFEAGKTSNSVLIDGILKAGEDNASRGTQSIYAAPYITLADGTTLVCTQEVKRSLQDVMVSVDNQWGRIIKANRDAIIEKLYTPYLAQLTDWNLPNIASQADGTRYPKDLKILSIGNSFSQDAMYRLKDILTAEGYPDAEIAYLYIGGCTLKTHATNAATNAPNYTFYTNYEGTWKSVSKSTMLSGIIANDWDIITLQQGSTDSGKPDTFEPYITQLIDYINANKTNPNARIVWHMTWAYQQDSTHSSFPKYDNDQMTMYTAIVDAMQQNVLPNANFTEILPNGTAVQNARTSYLGDNLTRDGYHLDKNFGRTLAAYTWLTVLFDHELTEVNYNPTDFTLSEKDRALIVEAVNAAIKAPCQITESQIKN